MSIPKNETRIAVFPGSFDPITTGHVNLVKRALPLFDKIIVAIGLNDQKRYLFPLEQRRAWVEQSFSAFESVSVETYDSLTTDFCLQHRARYVLRGVRNATDFAYEENIARINSRLNPSIETIFLLSDEQHSIVSSSMIRELLKFKQDISAYVPSVVAHDLS